MTQSNQPRESDLEHVVSLTGDDVEAIDAALLLAVDSNWQEARDVAEGAHASLQSRYPSVPFVFYSFRLRALIAERVVDAMGIVDRELRYQVRTIFHTSMP